MIEFIQAVRANEFLQNAVLTAVLASLACGIIGTYVVVKRMTFISGGISHAVLGGMGIAYYFGRGPLYGAVIAALVAAVIIGLVSLRAGEHEDTLIGALWAVGMAIGIVFLYKTPGYAVNLLSYLFGNILLVTPTNLRLLALLDVAVLALVAGFYKIFLAISFDEEFTRLQGVAVEVFYLLLLCLTALTVVILVQVVGIVLVIALLTLPAAVAGQWTRSLNQMMVAACVITLLVTFSGLGLAYGPDLPPGATVVLVAGSVYVLSTLVKRIAKGVRQRRLRKGDATRSPLPAVTVSDRNAP